MGLLNRLHKNCDNFRMSLYADDVAVFIQSGKQNLEVTKLILQMFGEASGLITNMNKTEIYPIRCENIDLNLQMGEQLQT